MKRKTGWSIITIVVVFAAYHLLLNPWSRIESEEWAIDIRTGRERYTKYVLYIPIERKISENWLSRNLKGGSELGSDWKTVGTSTRRAPHSPHYIFHSAISHLGYLKLMEEFGETPDEAFQKIATNTVKLWQLFERDSEAGYYLRDIDMLTLEKGSRGVSVDEVPDLLAWMKQRLKQMEEEDEYSSYIERYRGFVQKLEAEQGAVVNASAAPGLSENHLHD